MSWVRNSPSHSPSSPNTTHYNLILSPLLTEVGSDGLGNAVSGGT